MNYATERENNIVKNIAKEIVVECAQSGFEVTQELADALVKLKLLNPRNGFTASEVMPRSLIQQLVMLVVEELKQDTPAMNCIRMQVYWDFVKMDVADMKKEFFGQSSDKMETFLADTLATEKEESNKLMKNLAGYILCSHNLGSSSQAIDLRETIAAIHSVFKQNEVTAYFDMTTEQKTEKIKTVADLVTGVRLYLKFLGKAGEGVREVSDLPEKIEIFKKELCTYVTKLSVKIEVIRDVILDIVQIDYFTMNFTPANVIENLPLDCTMDDYVHLKKILTIMLQHRIYLSDILSKVEEIDGDSNCYLTEFNETLERIHTTIRGRDAVPTTEVFDDFARVAGIWMEIQSYVYCIENIQKIVENLENINKKEYFVSTALEDVFMLKSKPAEGKIEKVDERKKSVGSAKSRELNSAITLKDAEDFPVEFNGYCAWTLFYVPGFLVPSSPEAGIFQFQEQYYSFSNRFAHEFWAKDPNFCLGEIYEYLRENPELIFLLNAYENLYNTKNLYVKEKIDRKVPTKKESIQTELHPIPELWDKDYTFSIWELKKRALTLSRLVKCVTKSVQTVSPHSHFRASIGLLAAPDKDKEVQTKRDSSCNHEVISNYLYGLRGHREDKFCVVEMTRPVDESCQKQIFLEERDLCRLRQDRKPASDRFWLGPCPSESSDEKCDFYDSSSDYLNKYGEY